MRHLKGFSLRRLGRPKGSRAIDCNQKDFFPVEKFLSQCGWQKPPSAEAPAAQRGRAARSAASPRLLIGGESSTNTSSEDLNDFCDF